MRQVMFVFVAAWCALLLTWIAGCLLVQSINGWRRGRRWRVQSDAMWTELDNWQPAENVS